LAARAATADVHITVPDAHPLLMPVLFVIPAVSFSRTHRVRQRAAVDQPLNLRRIVTVELFPEVPSFQSARVHLRKTLDDGTLEPWNSFSFTQPQTHSPLSCCAFVSACPPCAADYRGTVRIAMRSSSRHVLGSVGDGDHSAYNVIEVVA